MGFLVTDAFAQQGPAPTDAGFGGALLFPILLFVVFYFLLIRPQQKRAKEQKKMVEGLAKGDEVVTNGGLLGRINKVDEHFIALEIADGLEVKVQRHAVASLMPKGTLKAS
ncbi:MAG: preprotein translocase subunit YajC [Gammaproteobacteria bacterium]|jgi:preprotein translocase subunit YajC